LCSQGSHWDKTCLRCHDCASPNHAALSAIRRELIVEPAGYDAAAPVDHVLAEVRPRPAVFQVACHVFAGDATNSKVWRGSKVHAVEVRSIYLLNSSALSPDATVMSATVHENFYCDLQAPGPEKTSNATDNVRVVLDNFVNPPR
jgi:hypothetical protein